MKLFNFKVWEIKAAKTEEMPGKSPDFMISDMRYVHLKSPLPHINNTAFILSPLTPAYYVARLVPIFNNNLINTKLIIGKSMETVPYVHPGTADPCLREGTDHVRISVRFVPAGIIHRYRTNTQYRPDPLKAKPETAGLCRLCGSSITIFTCFEKRI